MDGLPTDRYPAAKTSPRIGRKNVRRRSVVQQTNGVPFALDLVKWREGACDLHHCDVQE